MYFCIFDVYRWQLVYGCLRCHKISKDKNMLFNLNLKVFFTMSNSAHNYLENYKLQTSPLNGGGIKSMLIQLPHAEMHQENKYPSWNFQPIWSWLDLFQRSIARGFAWDDGSAFKETYKSCSTLSWFKRERKQKLINLPNVYTRWTLSVHAQLVVKNVLQKCFEGRTRNPTRITNKHFQFCFAYKI